SGEGGQTASDTPTPAPLPNPDTGAEPAIDPELGYRVSGHGPKAQPSPGRTGRHRAIAGAPRVTWRAMAPGR
ncbi:MAG: hypothetical protein LBD77_03745, partial [Bifidobacteriaceae bacterium]|nr:hypothetical protein [Bifidobacteriaceae bacterium]